MIVWYLIAVFSVCCYALLSPMAKKIGVELPPFTLIACSSIILGTCAAITAFFREREQVIAVASKVEWGWLVIFSLTNLVGYVTYLWALNKIPVAHYQMLNIISPVIGGLLAFVMLRESFPLRYFPALLLMLVGLAIALKPWEKAP
jgi:drug/metabolite transporter (DMT)-like permease